jgi:internalin A
VITDKLDEIHKSYEPLRVKKMIPCNCFVCKNSQNPHFYARDKLQQRIPKNEQNLEGDKPPYNEVDFLSLRDDRIGRENLS